MCIKLGKWFCQYCKLSSRPVTYFQVSSCVFRWLFRCCIGVCSIKSFVYFLCKLQWYMHWCNFLISKWIFTWLYVHLTHTASFLIVIVEITSHPVSVVNYVSTTVTLSCEATGSDPISYQWRKVNGEISSERATGVTTSTLTISPVREEDEDEYYCVTTNVGVDGMTYSDKSQLAKITVFGT